MPSRSWRGAAAILFGTLPFDAGVPTTRGRLDGARVLIIHGDQDVVIPRELLDRTWSYLHGGAGSDTTGVREAGTGSVRRRSPTSSGGSARCSTTQGSRHERGPAV